MAEQASRVTARIAALGAVSAKQQERIARDKRIGEAAVRLGTAIGKRDQAVADAELAAAAAIRAMVAEGVPLVEVPDWVGDVIKVGEVTRLAKLEPDRDAS